MQVAAAKAAAHPDLKVGAKEVRAALAELEARTPAPSPEPAELSPEQPAVMVPLRFAVGDAVQCNTVRQPVPIITTNDQPGGAERT